MSEEFDSVSDDGGDGGIAVRRLVPVKGLTSPRIIRAVRATLDGRPFSSISVAIVDDAAIASLHERYLGDPSPTDVLTFDLRDDPEVDAIEGEIVVSADTARRQGKAFGQTAAMEVLRYIVHGTLHLMGYDDQTPADRKRMRGREDRLLGKLG